MSQRRFTDFSLLKRKISGRDKYNRPMYECKNWDCKNLTYSHRCKECNGKNKRGLSWNSTSSDKRKVKEVLLC